MKTCTRCKKEYPEIEFTKRKDTKDGLSTRCKNCEKEIRQQNSEKRNKQQKEYYQKHKDHYKEYNKKYQKEHKEQIKEYCTENKEKRSLAYKKWYEKNKEHKKIYDEQYRKMYAEIHKNDVFEKVCECCGKNFVVKYNKRYTKYCSYECYYKCYISKVKKAINHKYGVDFATQSKEVMAKIKKTCQEKYGVDYTCLLPQCRENNNKIISQLNKSFAELLFYEYNIETSFEYKINNNDKFYYDLNVKDTNILIEINPTFTHTCVDTGIFNPKSPDYHINKTLFAQSQGYRCINVWDWDDWNKIVNLIKPKQTLYARKLELKEISKQLANEFLDKYHLQNSCYGNSVNLGLFLNDNLVQVMTFGKPRYNKNYEWELLRLCSKPEYMIVGGAEKLFKHFICTNNPKSIISYCDMSKFSGDVYKRLGMTLKNISKPQKIWSKDLDYITDNLLRQRGFDQLFNTNYGKGTDNEQLMIKHNWLPVYDCGQKVFVWYNM